MVDNDRVCKNLVMEKAKLDECMLH